MRYSLWSCGRIVGYTDLDIHTVTPTMRQGFVEPTADGASVLADATSVWRALAEVRRGARARGESKGTDRTLVEAALQRREGLDLELRDENGIAVDSDFIRIYDLFDIEGGVVDEMSPTEEEEESEFQIRLSALSGEARDEMLSRRAEMEAEVEAMVSEMRAEQNERDLGSTWPPPPPEDPRWDTQQYLLQLYLKGNAWDEPAL